MKNILKICLIAILTMALLFTVVACGGEKAPDNGGENNGGENNGGENNGGENNGGENNGGENNGGENNGDEGEGEGEGEGESEGGGTIDIVTDTEGVWGDVNFIG